ncbi:MAG: hypothetical protein JJ979_03525 [Roseibium sp.]|nr:hypothetical protein [Roseibium sp.]
MGAYAYCQKCGCGCGPPSAQEVVDGFWECGCGEKNPVHMSTEDLIV